MRRVLPTLSPGFPKLLLILPLLLSVSTQTWLTADAQDDGGEVIVIAELNRAEVNQFIEEAEDQFYAIFNANVDDEDYQITCRRETPTGSNISVRVCEPKFMIDARAENANTIGFNAGVVEPERAIRSALQPEYQSLQEKMEAMTQSNPEFAQIASILSQLRARRAQLQN
jgi:hypothetical protein